MLLSITFIDNIYSCRDLSRNYLSLFQERGVVSLNFIQTLFLIHPMADLVVVTFWFYEAIK
jgi:hypothetical protein